MSSYPKPVRNLAVSVYDLIPHQSEQLEMFSSRSHAVAKAMDEINDKWGEFMITPALMMDMDDTIIDRIWIAGLASCLVLSWWLSGGNLFLTGITLLLPIGAWLLFGWYRWALLLPLSLMGLLALIGAFYLW